MKTKFTMLACFLAFVFLSTTALATEADGPIDAYQIELVVFQHIDKQSVNEEIWPSDPRLPMAKNPLPLNNLPPEKGLIPLQSTDYKLSAVADRIKNRADYTVLFHGGWQENSQLINTPIPVSITANGLDDPNASSSLNGFVTIKKRHYFQVNTDLALKVPLTRLKPWMETLPQLNEPTMTFTLHTHRRMRSKELYYIDHPMLGVLIQITPVYGKTA